MPKPTIYIETSIVSYLTALGSRDLVVAAQQELTRGWWGSRTVVLEKDLPEYGLCRGDLGAVVELYGPDGLEVEFVRASGRSLVANDGAHDVAIINYH